MSGADATTHSWGRQWLAVAYRSKVPSTWEWSSDQVLGKTPHVLCVPGSGCWSKANLGLDFLPWEGLRVPSPTNISFNPMPIAGLIHRGTQ